MKLAHSLIGAAVLVLFVLFQQCSTGDSVGGIAAQDQSSEGSVLPTVSVDNATVALSAVNNFSVAGNCSSGSLTAYSFQLIYKENGSSATGVSMQNATCGNGRFSVTVPAATLGMQLGSPGVLTISIVGDAIEGLGANVNITWTSSPTTGTTTGTTPGTTTGPTCPRTDGTCTSPDPFVANGGGYCHAGGWVPLNYPTVPACAQ
jgi:hypothetical protein